MFHRSGGVIATLTAAGTSVLLAGSAMLARSPDPAAY
jgi:hypothetical protein